MNIASLRLAVVVVVFVLIVYRFAAAWTPVWLDGLVLFLTGAIVVSSICLARTKKADPKDTDTQRPKGSASN